MTDNIITINVKLTQGDCMIKIKDNIATCIFSKEGIAKQLYEVEKKAGNKNVAYIKGVYVEKYPNLTKEQILAKITKEIEAQGGKLIK